MKYLLPFLFSTVSLFAQKPAVNEYADIDKKALQLPDSLTKTTTGIASYIKANFKTDREKARAIFVWTASSISYDVENMYAINFYETDSAKIGKALRTRKGICENYAIVFQDVCSKSGVASYVVLGYTKQNGKADYVPHAWCVAMVDTAWYLFDPTWGSGSTQSGKFVKKINNEYFMASPTVFIKSHMPFDYLWQLFYYPISNQEFYEGRTAPNKTKPFFDYADSIRVYASLSYTEQLSASSRRIEKNGVKNSMIFDRLQHIKMEQENEKIKRYNEAAGTYNEGANDYNSFIDYKNKQFSPSKPDAEIQKMLDLPAHKLKSARSKIQQIKDPSAHVSSLIAQLSKTIDDLVGQVQEQQTWLTTYFSKGKSGRKSMFYEKKVSLFGVPLNK